MGNKQRSDSDELVLDSSHPVTPVVWNNQALHGLMEVFDASI
jgi:hypothetical protein